jgi:hypothetical protein
VALAPAADFFVLAALLMARHVCKYKSAARCILKHAAAAAVCTRWRNNCARELRARPNSAHAPFNLCRGIKIYARASTTSRTQKKDGGICRLRAPRDVHPLALTFALPGNGLIPQRRSLFQIRGCVFFSFSPSRSVSARAALVVLLLYLFGIKATGWSENKSCPAPQREPVLGIWPL